MTSCFEITYKQYNNHEKKHFIFIIVFAHYFCGTV